MKIHNNSTALLIIFNNININMQMPLTLRRSIMRQLSSFVDVCSMYVCIS